MFTQCCYIRKNTPKLRNKLKKITGTRKWLFSLRNGYGDCIVHSKTDDSTGNLPEPLRLSPLIDPELIQPGYIDCGINEDLFLALAALRDDTDINQWFVLDTNVSMASENFKPKGTFILCNRNSWFHDLDKDGKPSLFSSQNIPAHKATVQELIEHFKTLAKS